MSWAGINDTYEVWFKDTNDLLSLYVWYDVLESIVHIEEEMSVKVEKFKPVINDEAVWQAAGWEKSFGASLKYQINE